MPFKEISFDFFVKKILKSTAIFQINPYKSVYLTDRIRVEGDKIIYYNGGSVSVFLERDINQKINITKDSFLINRLNWNYEEDEEGECDPDGYAPMKKVGDPFLVQYEIQLLKPSFNK